jgi:DNA-binding CsgD family transcriptional regulator/tetratricopeptide (TPR) repeat protein
MQEPSSEFASSRPQARRLSVFVGRERELGALESALLAAEAGSGGVVLLGGEPGVGKTRLLREAAAAAEGKGWRVLLGHAYDSEGMPPYLPFIEALQDYVRSCPVDQLREQLGAGARDVASILPEVARRLSDLPAESQLDAESARYELFESLTRFLEGIAHASGPGLLLGLDDLHWADESTLLLLEHVARRLANAPLLLVATYRDTELPMAHSLARTLEQFVRQRLAERLEIRRLNQDEVGLMLTSLGPPNPPAVLAQAIYSGTEGNPFFVQEVFEHLADADRLFDANGAWRRDLQVSELDVPQGVHLVIVRRLDRLSGVCRRVLGQASVLGRRFDFEVLLRIGELDEDTLLGALEEAERAHLLEPEPDGRPRFSHELIRQTLLTELSVARRQRLHQRAAAIMEEMHASNLAPHLAELASHYRSAGAAGDHQKAIDYSVRAGDASRAVYAWEQAVSHYEGALRAFELSGRRSQREHCDLLLGLGEALVGAGQEARIVGEVAPMALSLAQAIDDDRRAFAACHLVMEATSGATAQSWLETAERYLGGDPHARIEFNQRKSSRSLHQGRFVEAKALLEEAMVLAREVGVPVAERRAATFLMRIGLLTAEEEGELFKETSRLPHTGMGTKDASETILDAVMIHLQKGDRDGAEVERRELAVMARRTGHHWAESASTAAETLFATLDGRLLEAMEAAAAVGHGTFPRLWHGRLAGWLGDTQAVESELAWNKGRASYFATGERAFYLAYAGRLVEARDVLAGIPGLATRSVEFIPHSHRFVLLEAANISGARTVAPRFLDEANLDPRRLAKPQFSFAPRHLAGVAALLGQFDRARNAYLEAIKFGERLRYRPEVALTRLELAQLLLTHYPSDRAEGFRHLDLAIGEFEAMGMQPALDRALLLPGRRPNYAAKPAFPDGLSQREVEVLKLMATGKSNQQIADELIISFNTVQRHVGHILTKTGLHNRTEAAAYAHRHDIA